MTSVALLEVDAELGVGLAPSEEEAARRALVVPVIGLAPGAWPPGRLAHRADALFGAVILSGRMQRSVEVGGRTTTQLLGVGDVVRPWDPDDASLPGHALTWAVAEACELGLLDRRFVALASRWPTIVIELSRRLAEQADRTQLQLGVCQLGRVEDRVLVLLWQLGQRWGRMTPTGIVVPIRLTHAAIASLVGATRPPVSTAIGDLRRAGLIDRTADGWRVDRRAEAAVEEVLSGEDRSRPRAARLELVARGR